MRNDVVTATYDPQSDIKVLVSPCGEVWNEYDALKSLGLRATTETLTALEVEWLNSIDSSYVVNDQHLGFFSMGEYIVEIQNYENP